MKFTEKIGDISNTYEGTPQEISNLVIMLREETFTLDSGIAECEKEPTIKNPYDESGCIEIDYRDIQTAVINFLVEKNLMKPKDVIYFKNQDINNILKVEILKQ